MVLLSSFYVNRSPHQQSTHCHRITIQFYSQLLKKTSSDLSQVHSDHVMLPTSLIDRFYFHFLTISLQKMLSLQYDLYTHTYENCSFYRLSMHRATPELRRHITRMSFSSDEGHIRSLFTTVNNTCYRTSSHLL